MWGAGVVSASPERESLISAPVHTQPVCDHAETVLQALHLLGPDEVDDAAMHEGQLHGYEALRLLVAERDEARLDRDLNDGLRAGAEELLEAAEAALRAECRCRTCQGDGLYHCTCDKQVCTCRVNEVPRPPCYACGGSGLRPRTPEARAVLHNTQSGAEPS